ncbi:MAG: late competence development ComFB family protein [Desulfovermiculus sp.]
MRKQKKQVDIPHLGIIELNGIHNRNEDRVVAFMPEVLDEFPDFDPDRINIQDIYALSLNLLPPRYTQAFSIVLQEPVSDNQVRNAVRQAIHKIQRNPK